MHRPGHDRSMTHLSPGHRWRSTAKIGPSQVNRCTLLRLNRSMIVHCESDVPAQIGRSSASEAKRIMELIFRKTQYGDIEALFSVRARTRQNPLSISRLATLGITLESTAKAIASGRVSGWVCTDAGPVVGFCSGCSDTGEVMVLAVLPEYEARGIGSRLLTLVVEWFRSCGHDRIWLAASPKPEVRAYGFYRSLGWHPT